jgi:uracil-DNA glycosylase
VVILGQDPYFDGSATGIAFANDFRKTGIKKISPSLNVVMQSVISLSDNPKSAIFDPTLESWAKQGILLLNSALTVRKGNPGSHLAAWKPFIERVLVALSGETNACFLLFGKVAWEFKSCIFDNARGVWEEYHPAYYARNNTKMPNTVWKNMIDYVQDNFNETLKLYD